MDGELTGYDIMTYASDEDLVQYLPDDIKIQVIDDIRTDKSGVSGTILLSDLFRVDSDEIWDAAEMKNKLHKSLFKSEVGRSSNKVSDEQVKVVVKMQNYEAFYEKHSRRKFVDVVDVDGRQLIKSDPDVPAKQVYGLYFKEILSDDAYKKWLDKYGNRPVRDMWADIAYTRVTLEDGT